MYHCPSCPNPRSCRRHSRLWERQGKLPPPELLWPKKIFSRRHNLHPKPNKSASSSIPRHPACPRPKLHLFSQKHVLYGILVALMISAASFTAVRSGLIPSPAPLISNLNLWSLLSVVLRGLCEHELSTINGAAGTVLASQAAVRPVFKVNPAEFSQDIKAPNISTASPPATTSPYRWSKPDYLICPARSIQKF